MINNLSDFSISSTMLKKVVREVIGSREVSVALIKPARMRELNRTYRQKDYPTDVLSFGTEEVIVCPEEAIKNGENPEVEVVRALIHGLLHTEGLKHSEMDEDKYLAKFFSYAIIQKT
jgi:probable rRNA maturation factor